MVKKGEYFDYAVDLEKRSIDFNPLIKPKEDEIIVGTELSIILEIAKKIKELEDRINELEKG